MPSRPKADELTEDLLPQERRLLFPDSETAAHRKHDDGDDTESLDEEIEISGWRKRGIVVLLCVLTALLFADQNIIAPNLTAIAHEFGFNDKERDQKLGGDLALAFFIIGAPASLIIGWLTDKVQRNYLFCAVILLGEAPCMCTIFVKTYNQLVVLRAVTGIAIGGAIPLIFSMLGDMFRVEHRAAVASLISVAINLGISCGQLLSGLVGPALGWRMPFLFIAAPSMVLGVAGVWLLPEPRRGATEDALQRKFRGAGGQFTYEERISVGKAAAIFAVPSNLLIFLQAIAGCLPWGVVYTFLNDYLSQQLRLSVPHATVVVTALNIGASLGALVGGFVGQWVYSRERREGGGSGVGSLTCLMGSSTLLATLPLLFILNPPDPLPSLGVLSAVAFLAGLLACITGPNIRAMLLNVNTPETRGTSFALYNLMDDLGKGMGPALIACVIGALGRQKGFTWVVGGGWTACGVVVLGLAGTVPRDSARVQRALAGSHAPPDHHPAQPDEEEGRAGAQRSTAREEGAGEERRAGSRGGRRSLEGPRDPRARAQDSAQGKAGRAKGRPRLPTV